MEGKKESSTQAKNSEQETEENDIEEGDIERFSNVEEASSELSHGTYTGTVPPAGKEDE